MVKIIQFLLDASRNRILAIQNLLSREVLVLGDSHAEIFSRPELHILFPQRCFRVVTVGGASVSGLRNPNSVTQALPIFMEALTKSKARKVIVLLGEVDTGFVIWYRKEKYKTSVSEMLDQALRNYQDFLLKISRNRSLICVSAPLPTINDNQDWGAVANARKDVTTSQLARTKLTLQFNSSIKEFCQMHGIKYLDLDKESTGQNGLVDASLLNNDAYNHHYESDAYIKIIAPKLKRLI